MSTYEVSYYSNEHGQMCEETYSADISLDSIISDVKFYLDHPATTHNSDYAYIETDEFTVYVDADEWCYCG